MMGTRAAGKRPAEKLLTYDFPLRPDLIIRMTLPVELTSRDAQRLVDFVRSLAFPRRPS